MPIGCADHAGAAAKKARAIALLTAFMRESSSLVLQHNVTLLRSDWSTAAGAFIHPANPSGISSAPAPDCPTAALAERSARHDRLAAANCDDRQDQARLRGC